MSDKIKELSEKRDLAIDEMYKALFAKQNATIDYRKKLETFAKIDEQLEQAKKEEAENDTRN